MQSTLRQYPGAAANRKDKLIRAIDSVVAQTISDWELIVVADNCTETAFCVKQYTDERIKLVFSDIKHEKWSSLCRTIGKDEARGQLILYLDNDDFISPDYLEQITEATKGSDKRLFFVDHFELDKNEFKVIRARIAMNSAGTANVIHTKDVQSNWPTDATYGSEDWTFIKRVIAEVTHYEHLNVAGYYIAHKRNIYDI
jgi:glycosyltransferase involved in cell wall biosynthesis